MLLSTPVVCDAVQDGTSKFDSDEADEDGVHGTNKKVLEAKRKERRHADEQIRAAFVHKSSLVDLDDQSRFIRPEDIEKHYQVQ